ncbi:nucleotidyltransferase family protein [Methylobacterium sp. JK268]
MTRNDAIAQLRSHAEAVRARGATALSLFGSTARDEAAADSDLDLFIEYDPAGVVSLLDLVDIKLFLEAKLDVDVDITTRDSLHPRLRHHIETSAVRVF